MAKARLDTFERDLRMATAGFTGEALNKELAAYARLELAASIDRGEGSPNYTRYVNGREGAAEETVQAPGPILYDFTWWEEIVTFALNFAVERSPRKSGEYRRNWFIMTRGNRVRDLSSIPAGVDVILTNDRAYHRKIDVGHMKMSVPAGVVEDTRRAVVGRYGNIITAHRTVIDLPNPYILKGHYRRGFRKHARKGLKADTKAGTRMTYPALVMQLRA